MDGLDINTMTDAVERARLISGSLGRNIAEAKEDLTELEVSLAELAAAHATFHGDLSELSDDLEDCVTPYGGSI
jgi:hypothetical protein